MKNNFRPCRTPRLRARGFTLIELMIAMAIGLVIVLSLAVLMINVNRNNAEMSKSSTVIENGRFALQLLEEEVAHAGFWGGYVPLHEDMSYADVPSLASAGGTVPSAVPDPCKDYSTWTAEDRQNLVGIAVQGYEIPSTVPSPTLSVCASKVVSPKANTDVLFVRHAQTCVPGDSSSPECGSLTTGKLYFQNNYYIASTASVATPTFTLRAATSSTVTTATFPGLNRAGTAAAEVRRFMSTLFYVRDYAVTAGDGIPTLMRSEFDLSGGSLQHKTAEALVEGVEGFRVEYGIDSLSRSGANVDYTSAIQWTNSSKINPTNRGDGIPDGSYIRCTTASPCTAAQLMNVVSVKIYVLVRSSDSARSGGYTDSKTYTLGSTTLGPFNDGYKRHLYSKTIRLVNVSGRRESP